MCCLLGIEVPNLTFKSPTKRRMSVSVLFLLGHEDAYRIRRLGHPGCNLQKRTQKAHKHRLSAGVLLILRETLMRTVPPIANWNPLFKTNPGFVTQNYSNIRSASVFPEQLRNY